MCSRVVVVCQISPSEVSISQFLLLSGCDPSLRRDSRQVHCTSNSVYVVRVHCTCNCHCCCCMLHAHTGSVSNINSIHLATIRETSQWGRCIALCCLKRGTLYKTEVSPCTHDLATVDLEIFAVINFRRHCITTKIKNTKYFQRLIIYDSI